MSFPLRWKNKQTLGYITHEASTLSRVRFPVRQFAGTDNYYYRSTLSYYAERVMRNPHVALAVYGSPTRERILAYISLLPLPESTIFAVLRGERHETKIHTEEVETYERQGGYTLLAESVVVDPDHSEQLNTILTHLTDYWCEQYPDRYITKIYAQAESKRGDILIQKLFFAPREDLAPDAYMLDLARPGASRFVRRFQECMETKRKALEAAQKR